jgi:putative SOS response-associated peptidase YedK
MPVILAPADQEAWVDPCNRKAAELLRPCPAEAMEAYPVDSAVGNPRHEGPELVEPLPDWLGDT